jgi:SOS-response transcriptional repressor LexA
MSRAQVPFENDTDATARVPIDDMMTGAASNVHVVMTNSGLLADSVVPDGDTVIVHPPADTIALRSVSISPTPYERYRSRLTATD